MKFLVAYKKGNKNLLKIELDDGEQVWASTSSAVYSYAKNNFDEGENAGFEYTVKNGQYFVNRINKDGKSEKKEESKDDRSPEYICEDCGKELKDDKYKKCYSCNKNKKTSLSTAQYICEDCGKELKDGKYKKCFTCNKKNPSKTSSGRSSDVNESIKKQCALKATVHALQVLVGRVEGVDTLGEIIVELYPKVYNLIK